MAYAVNLTARAQRDLASLYEAIDAADSPAARNWYGGLKRAVLSLENLPCRRRVVRKQGQVRQLLYGRKPQVYLVLYRVVEKRKQVDVLHIRHGARQKFAASDLE